MSRNPEVLRCGLCGKALMLFGDGTMLFAGCEDSSCPLTFIGLEDDAVLAFNVRLATRPGSTVREEVKP